MTKFSGTKRRPLHPNLTAPIRTLRDRIRALQREQDPARFNVDGPASQLFTNFPVLSRIMTRSVWPQIGVARR